MSIDWSNRSGTSFVTGPRNQGGTNFCWGFAVTGLIESMVRIEHGAWCARSEGDVFTGLDFYGFLGGNPPIAGDFVGANGLADPDCMPWSGFELNYTFPASASADRVGRTVRAPALTAVSGLATQKAWLETVGPLVATFDVSADFDAFYAAGSGVYRRAGNLPVRGIHIVLIIGYDDNQGCWIAKNSWGIRSAHPQAIFRIAFGEVRIDDFEKYGLQRTNPDPATKRRHHAGGLLVSGNGRQRANLEFVAAAPSGAARWWFKDSASLAWSMVGDFGSGHPFVSGQVVSDVYLTQTTFDRNFEAVWRSDPPGRNGPIQHWVFVQDTKQWNPAAPLGFGPGDADGGPVLIQSNFGEPGSLEVLVHTTSGEVSHWTRRDARPWQGTPPGMWQERGRFGSGIRRGTPALMQKRTGAWPWGERAAGELVAVCTTTAGRLQHWQWDGGPWYLVEEFGGGVDSGTPRMIEAMTGHSEWEAGPLVLFVAVDGGIEHWSLSSEDGARWQRLGRFAIAVSDVLGVAQGHVGLRGIDLVARTDSGVLQHWRVATVVGGMKYSHLADLP